MARTRAIQTGWPDLNLTDEWREYAKLHGVDGEVEFESFRDHHLAKGSKFADWWAAFRTWIRNAEKYKREKQPIGFTATPRLSMELRQAQRDNEEVEREVASLTPQQRVENLKRLQAIIGSIK